MNQQLIMIEVSKLRPHPDNPRKDIGDIEELTESVKKNGIMQNLTVIPGCYMTRDEYAQLYYKETGKKPDLHDVPDNKEDLYTPDPTAYTVLIGHRRLAAAKAAGLKSVPCRVAPGMTYREQVGIMLEENMQRTDLTVTEQAFGFQMMLDLGETPETIAEKTGFSKMTVKHRLEIAKLDKKLLKKQSDGSSEFQLTISDYLAMERVKDLKERNHIFRTAKDSRDLKYKVDLYCEKKKREKNAKIIISMLEDMGIHLMSPEQYGQRYSSKWEYAEAISLEEDPPEELKIKGAEKPDNVFYAEVGKYDCRISLYRKADKKKVAEKSKWEKEREELERKRKELTKLHTAMKKDRKVFVQGILDGKYGDPKNRMKALEDLIEAAIGLNVQMYAEHVPEWITGKQGYRQSPEEKGEAFEIFQEMDDLEKILVMTDFTAATSVLVDWRGAWYKSTGEAVAYYHSILEEQWGFRIEDEAIAQMLDGTHEYYVKER